MKNKFSSRTGGREELEKAQQPRVVNIPSRMAHFGKGTVPW